MNVFTATGNIGRDCENRTVGETSLCTFSMAVKAGYGDKESTVWVRCAIWGKRAEGQLPQYLVKGCQVAVSGELSLNVYTNSDGVEKTSLELRVNELDLIGGRSSSGQSQQTNEIPAQQNNYAGGASVGDDVPFSPCF